MDAAASTYAGVFQETADNFNQAAGALGALGGSSSSDGSSRVTATNAIIARFTTTAPDGQQREYQRTIYDARFPVLTPAGLSDPARFNEQAYRAITRMFTFQVHAGSPSPARLLDAQLEAYLQRRPSLEGIVSYHYEGEQALERAAVTDAGDQVSWMGHRMLATLFDALPDSEPAHSSYRDRPNIAVHYRTLPIGETIQEGIDIVQNSRRAFADIGGELVADPAALIRSGVWETATEGSLLMPGSGPDINTVDVFAQARGNGLQTRVLNAVDDAADLMYSEISLEAIERDLAMGYTVVLPSYDPSVNTPVAWWRVNPETGETLGMGFNGEGAVMQEYAQKLVLIGLGAAWAVQIYGVCLTGVAFSQNLDSNTCSSVAISTSALGLSIVTGNVVGAAMATAALMNIVRIKVTSQ